jgi:hypothetical protein
LEAGHLVESRWRAGADTNNQRKHDFVRQQSRQGMSRGQGGRPTRTPTDADVVDGSVAVLEGGQTRAHE